MIKERRKLEPNKMGAKRAGQQQHQPKRRMRSNTKMKAKLFGEDFSVEFIEFFEFL